MSDRPLLQEIEENIFIVYGEKPSSHVYIIKGQYKNVLIDTGTRANFHRIVLALTQVGLKVSDIHLVICTHEHYDHVGGIGFFYESALIAADRFAATKLELQDEYVIHAIVHGEEAIQSRVNLWLTDQNIFDFGNYMFRVFYTPGHTSGCICLYEVNHRFLFSGDSVFADGVIAKISESGSYGDYINSLERLSTIQIRRIFPGHGKICDYPQETLKQSIATARLHLQEYNQLLLERRKKEVGQ